MAKILIIDDNAIMRKNIWFMLRRDHHTILEAEDGPVGIAMARAEKPDLILLDFMLPYMSGEQVARYFFDHEELSQIPIIMLTAMNQPDVIVQLLKLNVRDYLLKPVKAEVLRDRVSGLVGHVPVEPVVTTPEPPKMDVETEEEAQAETEVI